MNKFLLVIVLALSCLPLRAQTLKGLPEDFTSYELLIVAYEPSDLIPADAKSHESIYRQLTPLQAQSVQANQQIAAVAKAKYPSRFRLVSKNDLPAFSADNAYIFEPGKLYSQPTVWSTTPLYIRHAASGLVYEIGFLPTHAIFFPEKIMEHFIQFVPKNLPVQASDKVAVKQ
ncbi:hypothetical protein I5M27_14940 [Adhaeribacter sp. BT258]|uniref:Uncharacterized protein n=1 Tax=Adhaeribacter terrigena TaxID=2793070 RepID=A0ABS1C4G5_9BACT|nr:hypothetical protein [Adhaeribacter terrigena]MBK0404291.1 hypothetical protein [Adhaeribacter terrigena]